MRPAATSPRCARGPSRTPRTNTAAYRRSGSVGARPLAMAGGRSVVSARFDDQMFEHWLLAARPRIGDALHHVQVPASAENGDGAGEVAHVTERDRELTSVHVAPGGWIGIDSAGGRV